jgi:cysteinyl-tRNA synthetase
LPTLPILCFLASLVVAGAHPDPLRLAETRLAASRTFAIQLQDLTFEGVARADPDVLVVDYSRDGDAGTELTTADVDRLRQRPDPSAPPRIVLAYLSVGEAEDYRFYWAEQAAKGRAPFVGAGNPLWPGNYLVRYWDPAWQEILFGPGRSYLGRILDQGFDGVYLDTVDALERHEEAGRADAAERMAELVVRLAAAARERRPGFLVVAQNAFRILRFPRVPAVLSGTVAEDVWFRGERLRSGPYSARILDSLDRFAAGGKAVMSIEYVRSPRARAAFRDLCARRDFLCTLADRSLNTPGVPIPRKAP